MLQKIIISVVTVAVVGTIGYFILARESSITLPLIPDNTRVEDKPPVVREIPIPVIPGSGSEQFEEETVTPAGSSIPGEYLIYQRYKTKTANYVRGVGYDEGVIEGTIVSVMKNDICPDATPEGVDDEIPVSSCSIEPYPQDTGTVRIDRITEYIPYSETPTQSEEMQQGEGVPDGSGESTSGFLGEGTPPKNYNPLTVGEEIFTRLILSARLAKVVYAERINRPVSNSPSSEGEEMPVSSNEDTISSGIIQPPTFSPIPKDGQYFVFTTQINQPKRLEKVLPGLAIGDRFSASFKYDGTLFIEEYSIISPKDN